MGAQEWPRVIQRFYFQRLSSWLVLFFNHRLTSDDEYGQCPDYIHREGHTAGCLLQAVEDEILHFYIFNGTHLLLSRAQWTSTYRKYQEENSLLIWLCGQEPHSYLSTEQFGLLERSISVHSLGKGSIFTEQVGRWSWESCDLKEQPQMWHGPLPSNRGREAPFYLWCHPFWVFLGILRVSW